MDKSLNARRPMLIYKTGNNNDNNSQLTYNNNGVQQQKF